MRTGGHGAVVESSVPGRVRLRLPPQKRTRESISELTKIFEAIEGVLSVSANIATGSLLLYLDSQVLSPDQLIDLAHATQIVSDNGETKPLPAEETIWPAPSAVARQIMNIMRRFDRSVSRLSGGAIDAKVLVAGLLLILALNRALQSRKPAPWHTLLWYGYSVFMQWHSPRGPGNGWRSS